MSTTNPSTTSAAEAAVAAAAAAASPRKPKSKPSAPPLDPSSIPTKRRLLCLALRYVVSNKEYAVLRRRVLMRSRTLSGITPKRSEFDAVVGAGEAENYLPAATRAGIRALVVTNTLLNLWDLIRARMAARRGVGTKLRDVVLAGRENFLSALSLAVLIVTHRVLYRFFAKLRQNLSLPQAKAFRVKYPRAAKLFLSQLAPGIGASLAGVALAIHPKGDRRTTVAVYALMKALEYNYNRLEDEGYFAERPWWFGSWLLFPLASAQLFHTFVFDRATLPAVYGAFMNNYSATYIPTRPDTYPSHLPWPDTSAVVSSLATVATSKYPAFSSPILFPNSSSLPPALAAVNPVISPAHPSIKSLECALLHPTEPSCGKTNLSFWAAELPRLFRLLTTLYTLAWLPRHAKFMSSPASGIMNILTSATRSSIFTAGTIGTTWGSLCFFQKFMPRTLLPTSRFYLAGALGGLWAAVDRTGGRAQFLYAFRIALVSLWKQVKGRSKWARKVRNGDVLLFVVALMGVNAVYERDRGAVGGRGVRKALASLRGRGWRDEVKDEREKMDQKMKEKHAGKA